jgi:glucosamine-6-phosphate deaminase
MQINVSKNYEELCKEVANYIVDKIKELSLPLLCLAGGDTPLGVYKNLVELSKSGRVGFKNAEFIGLDEWVGLDGSDSGSCRFTLDQSLYGPLAIEKSKIQFFDGKASDLSRQCDQINQFLESNGSIDLALLGIGMNGHIGFNEPGSTLESICRVVSLDETTQTVGQKYFEIEQELNQGITLGLKQILETRTVILIVSGEKKRSIVKTLLSSEIADPSIPVTSLWQHPNCLLFLDKAAYSEA